MTLKLRKASLRDLHRIVRFYGRIGDSPLDPFADVSRLRELDLTHLLVAEQDSKFAGFTYYFIHRRPWFDPRVERYATIMELHVRSQFMGRGIGTSLLLKALAEIRQQGVRVVYVDTGEDNSVALHVYRKAGFKDFRKQIKLKLTLQQNHCTRL